MGMNAQEVNLKDKKAKKTEKSAFHKKVSDKSSKSNKVENDKPSCSTDDKSKKSSSEPKSCKADGSCCGGSKKSSRE